MFWIQNDGLFRWTVLSLLSVNALNGLVGNCVALLGRWDTRCKRMHYHRGYGRMPDPQSADEGTEMVVASPGGPSVLGTGNGSSQQAGLGEEPPRPDLPQAGASGAV